MYNMWNLVLLLGLAQLTVISKANIEVAVTCADALILYADNQEIGSHNNKQNAKSFLLPSNTEVIAIRCQVDPLKSEVGGILASFSREHEGDYITDATWRCSKDYVAGWAQTTYNDMAWPYANTLGNNSNDSNNGRPLGLDKVSGIADHGKWIWTTDYQANTGDLIVYCRGHIGIGETRDNYGRKFVIGFIDNIDWQFYNYSVTDYPPKDIKLLFTTLKPTGVTVLVYTPLLSSGTPGYVNKALTITAGQVEVLTLPKELEHENHHGIQDKAVVVVSTDSVRVVGENTETYSTDLFLAMPITSLGTETESNEYFGVCWNYGRNCRILIAAGYENTNLNIKAADNITYGGVFYKAGTTFQVQLTKKYQSVQLGSNTSTGLTSTHILSNKPIVVFSGNQKAHVTNLESGTSSDHLVEQLMPVKMWGKQFLATPLPYGSVGNSQTRSATYIALYTVMAARENTSVVLTFYDPSTGRNKGSISKTLNQGGVYTFAKTKGSIMIVSATKGIMVAQFATTATTQEQCIGDPWMQIIPPIYEFGRDYTLLTPNLTQLSTCTPIHYFTIVITEEDKSGILINKQRIDESKYISIPSTSFVYQTVEISFGEHRVEHENTTVSYGLYFFGYGAFDSYATMAGTRMLDINEPCVTSSSIPGDGLDNDCDGSIDEDYCTDSEPSKDCSPPSPIDGGWSAWFPAGPCVCSNGSSDGTAIYKRTCTKPVPMYDGWPCNTTVDGYNKQVACVCTPVDGNWTEWSSYSSCSPSCGPGKRIRTRSCTNPFPENGGKDCSGSRTEEESCVIKDCSTSTVVTSTADITTAPTVLSTSILTTPTVTVITSTVATSVGTSQITATTPVLTTSTVPSASTVTASTPLLPTTSIVTTTTTATTPAITAASSVVSTSVSIVITAGTVITSTAAGTASIVSATSSASATISTDISSSTIGPTTSTVTVEAVTAPVSDTTTTDQIITIDTDVIAEDITVGVNEQSIAKNQAQISSDNGGGIPMAAVGAVGALFAIIAVSVILVVVRYLKNKTNRIHAGRRRLANYEETEDYCSSDLAATPNPSAPLEHTHSFFGLPITTTSHS